MSELDSGRLSEKQESFIEAIEGIGDLLEFEISRQSDSKRIEDSLDKLVRITEDLLELQSSEPDKFEKIIFNTGFLEIYEKKEQDAKIFMSSRPEKCFRTFKSISQQFKKTHQVSIKVQNNDISSSSVFSLIRILTLITKLPERGLLARIILDDLESMGELARLENDISRHDSVYRWYTSVVFGSVIEQSDFDVSYLELFDKYFFRNLKVVVEEGEFDLFESIVDWLLTGISLRKHSRADVFSLRRKFKEISEDKFKELNQRVPFEELKKLRGIVAVETFSDWQQKLEEWIDEFISIVSTEEIEDLKEIRDSIIDEAKLNFLGRNLKKLIFSVGAYCVFKNKPHFIDELWTHKQPDDADAVMMGHNLTPNELTELFNLFLENGKVIKRDFHEGRHGSTLYHQQYFLLLLLKILEPIEKTDNQKTGEEFYKEIEQFSVPIGESSSLSNAENLIEQLEDIGQEIRNDEELLLSLDLVSEEKIEEEKNELFRDKLFPLLEKIREQVRQKHNKLEVDKKLDSASKDQFKEGLKEGFEENVYFRRFYKEIDSFQSVNIENWDQNILNVGFRDFTDRYVFFDEWHVDARAKNYGKMVGQSLAVQEDYTVIGKIIEESDTPDDEWSSWIGDNISGQFFGIITSVSILREFEDSGIEWIPEWTPEREFSNYKESNNFKGILKLDEETEIPIYQTVYQAEMTFLFFINKETPGEFIELTPPEDKENIFEGFEVKITDLSSRDRWPPESDQWLENSDPDEIKKLVMIDVEEQLYFDNSVEKLTSYKFDLSQNET